MTIQLKAKFEKTDKIVYSHHFKVIDTLPYVGNSWGIDGKVWKITPMWLAAEENNKNYNCYALHLDICGDKDYVDYVATKRD